MTTLFLTPAELANLTGRKRATHQVAWLKANGVPCWVNAAGKPVVARAAIEGSSNVKPAQADSAWVPRPLRAA